LRYVVSCVGRIRGRSLVMRNHYCVRVLFAVSVMCCLPSVSFGQKNTPSPEIKVRLSVPRNTVTVGTPIHVEVRITNSGDAATLVANTVSAWGDGTAFLEFKLTDAQGRVSSSGRMIADYFTATKPSDENAAAKLLGAWTLLYPRTSLLFDVAIDQSLLSSLANPGKYRLSANYASTGISYGRGGLGLSSDLLNSLPFPCWSGRVSTNDIPLTIESHRSTK
jgi:hypothetical protein